MVGGLYPIRACSVKRYIPPLSHPNLKLLGFRVRYPPTPLTRGVKNAPQGSTHFVDLGLFSGSLRRSIASAPGGAAGGKESQTLGFRFGFRFAVALNRERPWWGRWRQGFTNIGL